MISVANARLKYKGQTMKKIAFLLASSLATQVFSQSVEIGSLSTYEQSLHRLGWCTEAWMAEGMHGQPRLETYQIGDISLLLGSNGFTDADARSILRKAREDLQAQLITGQKLLDQNDLDTCFADLKNILSENYIPNFDYMVE